MSSKPLKTYYVNVDGPVQIGAALVRRGDPVSLSEKQAAAYGHQIAATKAETKAPSKAKSKSDTKPASKASQKD